MRVLLVDDDEPTRLICRRVLDRISGGTLVVDDAADGPEAMERLKAERYDGVLCDYRLGVVSGLEVLAFARDVQPRAFRALMTGFADPALQDAARQAAAVHSFIEKPMTSREFEAVLRDRFLAPMAAGQAQPGG